MSTFNPENREKTEKYREKQILDPKLEKKILERMDKVERYNDLIFCPNRKCGCDLRVEETEKTVIIKCKMCGWARTLKRSKKKPTS